MHIPDGFLSPPVIVVSFLITAVVVAIALYKLRNIEPRQLLVMGTLGAAVFGAQMLNFTILGGTSGHVIGAALLTVVAGPAGAIVTMLVINLTQSLLFADGGLTALGANVLNMGIVASLIAFFFFWLSRRASSRPIVIYGGIFVGSWLSVLVPAIFAAAELSLSGVVDPVIAVGMMAFWHLLIGFVEAIVTVGAVYYLRTLNLVQIGTEAELTEGSEVAPPPVPSKPVSSEGAP